VADIRAVGPGAWNAWKAQLLRDLYHEAEALMMGAGTGRGARAAAAREALTERLAMWPDEERTEAQAHHHDSYWLAFDEAQLDQHALLRREAKQSPQSFAYGARVDDLRGVIEIAVCTPDHRGLFSQLAGAIAAC